jgi:hypothetical protein
MKMKWTIGVAALALVGSFWTTAALAAKPVRGVYIPPTNMTVECTDQTIVTANAPTRTKYVQYTFYKPEPVYNARTYDPADPDAYFGFEGGPGWPAPLFPYATQVGGSPILTPSTATFVWAQAISRDASKPLAWGFAACKGAAPIPILLNSGSAQLLYQNGALTVL